MTDSGATEVIEYQNARLEIEGPLATFWFSDPEKLNALNPGMVEALRTLTPGLSDAQRRQPPLSPLYGDFSGLPPALMFVGELDPLRDDTRDIAERWGEVAQVEVHQLPECAHGFIHFPTALADRVLAYSREWINERIHRLPR